MYEPLPAGTLFCDRYEVVRVIDSGGMGIVYEVSDVRTKRRRALKTIQASLAANPEIRARFDLEATATAGIRSDHLVEVLDSGLDTLSGMPFLVMELLEGENLGSLLRKKGACTPAFVIDCLQQAAWALDKMHDAGVVHRDLKPENLILTLCDDGSPRVKIIDFGIVKVVARNSAAQTTRNVGTPCYMSPEQIRGDGCIDRRADLYALGHIAFALLTGRAYWEIEPCYEKGPVPLLARILQGGNRERATERAKSIGSCLPATFDAWFERATAQAARERHGSATQLVEELAVALGSSPRSATGSRLTSMRHDTACVEGRARRARRRAFAMVIGASAILLLTLVLLVSHSRRVISTERGSPGVLAVHQPALPQPVAVATMVPAASLGSAFSAPAPVAPVPLGTQRSRAKYTTPRTPRPVASPSAAEANVGSRYDPTDER